MYIVELQECMSGDSSYLDSAQSPETARGSATLRPAILFETTTFFAFSYPAQALAHSPSTTLLNSLLNNVISASDERSHVNSSITSDKC